MEASFRPDTKGSETTSIAAASRSVSSYRTGLPVFTTSSCCVFCSLRQLVKDRGIDSREVAESVASILGMRGRDPLGRTWRPATQERQLRAILGEARYRELVPDDSLGTSP